VSLPQLLKLYNFFTRSIPVICLLSPLGRLCSDQSAEHFELSCAPLCAAAAAVLRAVVRAGFGRAHRSPCHHQGRRRKASHQKEQEGGECADGDTSSEQEKSGEKENAETQSFKQKKTVLNNRCLKLPAIAGHANFEVCQSFVLRALFFFSGIRGPTEDVSKKTGFFFEIGGTLSWY